ncbi:MAG: glycosyltransferase [Candidatus Doudnabacteria bacterium]|nr:glycosyltransferase [Candidatus Doudnabacteria bacterium]
MNFIKNIVLLNIFKLWVLLSNKLLTYKIETLVARKADVNKVIEVYIDAAERLNESLAKYALRKDVTLEQKKDILAFLISSINRNIDHLTESDLHGLSIHKDQQQKVLKTYLEMEHSLYSVIKGLGNVNEIVDPQNGHEVLAKHLADFQNGVYLLLSTQKINNEELESKEDKFGINLAVGFEELLQFSDEDIKASKLNKDVQLSVVYPLRDREPERLITSVKSLAKYSSVGFEVLVVDYGSKDKQAQSIRTICNKYGLKLIRTETQGRPWSRAWALNIGIRNAESDVVVTTDMDMVFMDDILGTAFAQLKPATVVHCRPWWLKENGNAADAWLGDKNQLGGFQMIYRQEISDLGGFNENIFYWGAEDLELDKRMFRQGINTVWLDEKIKMYHMWHPTDYGVYDLRPQSSWFDSNRELIAAFDGSHYKNPDFGKTVSRTQRPILMKMTTKDKAHSIPIDKDYPVKIDNIIGVGQRHKFLCFEFGPRIFPDTRTYAPAIIDMDKYLNQYGLELKVQKNGYFDYFYLSLPYLQKAGMVDYFIAEDFSEAYILFE